MLSTKSRVSRKVQNKNYVFSLAQGSSSGHTLGDIRGLGNSGRHNLEGRRPLKNQAFRDEKDACAQCHVVSTCGMLFDLENPTNLARIMHNVRLKT